MKIFILMILHLLHLNPILEISNDDFHDSQLLIGGSLDEIIANMVQHPS